MRQRTIPIVTALAVLLLVAGPRLLAQTPRLDDGLASTPPMGWNSWNKFACHVDEQLIDETADAMASSGMKDAGYRYVVIDDCWQVYRDTSGILDWCGLGRSRHAGLATPMVGLPPQRAAYRALSCRTGVGPRSHLSSVAASS